MSKDTFLCGAILVVLATAGLAGCGDQKSLPSLDKALLKRKQLPAGVPPLKVSVTNASARAWVKATTPGGSARSLNRSELGRAGFKRGSARQFRSTGSSARIFLLIEAVAELGSPGSAQDLADRTFRRTQKNARGRPRVIKPESIGKDGKGLKAKVGDIPVYTLIWRKDRVLAYLAVVANPNTGPDQRDVEEAAGRLSRRIDRLLKK